MPRPPSRRDALALLSAPLMFAAQPVELAATAVSGRTLRVSLRSTQSVHTAKTLRWGTNRVTLSEDPFRLSITDRRGKQIQKLEFDSANSVVTFRNSAVPLFGLGEGGPQYDRRNHEYTMRNGQYNPDQRIEGGRVPIPWLFSPEGWGLFFQQPYGVTNLMGPEGKFTAAPGSGLPMEIFVMVGSPAEILREYAELTGYPHLPPLWSFGYQQSHRTLESREEVMDEASEFRRKKLPCDTMIYLGTGFCPSGWNTGHGSFHFNEKVFPDPAKMIEELHREHFHVVFHLTQPPDKVTGTVAEKGSIADRYWSTHREVFHLGTDGWWPDEGDKLSPESRLARDRLYWEGPLQDRPNVRPFALNRNGYAGIQRYGWLWTGDVNSDWRALAAQIPVGINTGLTGIPHWGTDIGGFIPTREFTGELYVRWFQFSTFCPLFRSHGRTWKLHLPWGWNTGDYGPIEVDKSQLTDASNLHNSEVEPICRKYMELRYRLMPYLYAAAREAHETGMPIIRAMWLHYPDDAEAMRRGDQYLWGRDMLIAPVIEAAATIRRLYLPKGDWYDYWTDERVAGGREIERKVDLETLPFYVRAGTIVPIGPVKQYVDEKVDAPLELRIYPGADGRFVLYEDDGVSFDYERGEFLRVVMVWNDARRELKLELAPGSKMFGGARELEVRLRGQETGKRVRFEGKALVVSLH